MTYDDKLMLIYTTPLYNHIRNYRPKSISYLFVQHKNAICLLKRRSLTRKRYELISDMIIAEMMQLNEVTP